MDNESRQKLIDDIVFQVSDIEESLHGLVRVVEDFQLDFMRSVDDIRMLLSEIMSRVNELGPDEQDF